MFLSILRSLNIYIKKGHQCSISKQLIKPIVFLCIVICGFWLIFLYIELQSGLVASTVTAFESIKRTRISLT